MRNPTSVCWLVAGLVCAPAWAQPSASYVSPKGGYDTPATFFIKLDEVGKTYAQVLGAPRSNAYQRSVSLKLLGLGDVIRLTALQKATAPQPTSDAEAKPKQEESGGLFGSLAKLKSLVSKEAERTKEAVQDDLQVQLTEAGSPLDQADAAVVDYIEPPNQVTGSFFGAKINNKTKVTVISDDFQPRVLLLRWIPKGLMATLPGDPAPTFKVVASGEVLEEGADRVTVRFDRSEKSKDGEVANIAIAVTSVDGKAPGGKYSIRFSND